jgi:hypothetical protein
MKKRHKATGLKGRGHLYPPLSLTGHCQQGPRLGSVRPGKAAAPREFSVPESQLLLVMGVLAL